MICIACSCKNLPDSFACGVCGARLPATVGDPADASAGTGLIDNDGHLEARIAEVELRVATLVQQFAAAGDVVASPLEPQPSPKRTCPTFYAGVYRVAFGDPHGAHIETRTEFTTTHMSQQPEGPRPDIISHTAMSPAGALADAGAAVWTALENGASSVRIDGRPGAGATTLLHLLSMRAREHGYTDGALWLTDVVGPAADVEGRLAAQATRELPQFSSGDSKREVNALHSRLQSLILLDRAKLTAPDLAKLRRLLPSCRFVLVQRDALADTARVEVGALKPDETLKLLADVWGRSIDDDNARVAIDICKMVGMLAGPVRLIGVAAREMQRSFISLRAAFGNADTIVKALANSRSPDQGRVLGILAFARTPLSSSQVGYIAGGTDVSGSLARLVACELVCGNGDGLYELPDHVAAMVPPLGDADMVSARVTDILYAAPTASSTMPLLNRQLLAAEALLRTAFERSQWTRVATLGPHLAEAFALRGTFGAWGRVLVLVEEAAMRAEDVVALTRARHDLGVRAIAFGEVSRGAAYLRSAARDRSAAGDVDGAAATTAVLALVDSAQALGEDAMPDRGLAPARAGFGPKPPGEAQFRPTQSPPTPSGEAPSGPTQSAQGQSGQTHSPDLPTVQTRPAKTQPGRAEPGPTQSAEPGPTQPGHSAHRRMQTAQTEPSQTGAPEKERRQSVAPETSRGAAIPARRILPQQTLMLAVAIAVIAILAFMLQPRADTTLAIRQISTQPATISAGESTQVCVQATKAAVVEVFPDAGRLPGTGRNCVAVHPTVTTTYIAVATSADGQQVRREAMVDVRARPGPQPHIATFAAFPARITAGQSTRLCYAVSGASVLRMVPRTGSLTRLHSCETVTLQEPHRYTYRLFASNENGQFAERQARVDVIAAGQPSAVTSTRTAFDGRLAREAVTVAVAKPVSIHAVVATAKPGATDQRTPTAAATLAGSADYAALHGAWEIDEANVQDGTMVWYGDAAPSSGGTIVLVARKESVAGRSATRCERQTNLHAAITLGVAQQTVPYHEVNCAGATSLGQIHVSSFSHSDRMFSGSFWQGGAKLGDFDARKL